ncbi:hypothetical protein AYI97_01810 [Shewanella algae]|nr:hypothetical protein AYI97_01810 [Shewanella algae]
MPSPSLQIHSSGFTKRCKWLQRTIRPFEYMAKVGRQLEPVINGMFKRFNMAAVVMADTR